MTLPGGRGVPAGTSAKEGCQSGGVAPAGVTRLALAAVLCTGLLSGAGYGPLGELGRERRPPPDCAVGTPRSHCGGGHKNKKKPWSTMVDHGRDNARAILRRTVNPVSGMAVSGWDQDTVD